MLNGKGTVMMGNEAYCHRGQIIINVKIPKGSFSNFVRAFGFEFKLNLEKAREFRAITSYSYILDDTHFNIEITLYNWEEERFGKFMREFCNKEGVYLPE